MNDNDKNLHPATDEVEGHATRGKGLVEDESTEGHAMTGKVAPSDDKGDDEEGTEGHGVRVRF